MPLCQPCQTIPFREIFEQMNGDESVRDLFSWFHTPWSSSTDESLKRAYIIWHGGVTQLKASAQSCSFCSVIQHDLNKSFHYTTRVQEGEKRKVWLEVPTQSSGSNPHRRGNPQFAVWIGDMRPESLVSGHWRFTTPPDSSIARFFGEHAVIEDTLHPAVLARMSSWLRSCNESHTNCAHLKKRTTSLPTRLLDLTSLPARQDMASAQLDWNTLFTGGFCRLIENSPDSSGDYIALSYCWGKSLAYTTTTNNLQTHKQQGISFSQLPKTLQDAVMLVKYLGFDYLWADCLCIVQDDKADWEHEAARMADVYSNAILTVAATRAAHCDEGFLRSRKVKIRQVVHYEDKEGQYDLHFVYDDCTISPGSMESVTPQPLRIQRDEPLLDRVWCFQERVLAVRTLHFATDQMYWECAQSFEEEQGIVRNSETDFYKEYSLTKIADALVKTGQSLDYRLQDAWFRMIQEYTSRNMTYQSDKLPALSGVISALQLLTSDICYAGLWRGWFLKGLLWRLQIPENDLYVFAPKKPHKPDFWRAPSWSFAAIEGVVLYDVLERALTFEYCAEFEDCNIIPSGRNPLGELKSGYATIKGPITTITTMAQKNIGHISNGRACTVRLLDRRRVYAGVHFDLETYETCDILMITPLAGLAIRPVDVSKGTYVRVGAVSVYMRMGIVDHKGDPLALEDQNLSLSASDYPEPSSITLL